MELFRYQLPSKIWGYQIAIPFATTCPPASPGSFELSSGYLACRLSTPHFPPYWERSVAPTLTDLKALEVATSLVMCRPGSKPWAGPGRAYLSWSRALVAAHQRLRPGPRKHKARAGGSGRGFGADNLGPPVTATNTMKQRFWCVFVFSFSFFH